MPYEIHKTYLPTENCRPVQDLWLEEHYLQYRSPTLTHLQKELFNISKVRDKTSTHLVTLV